MKQEEAIFIGERAEQLAFVYLSRRNDLIIKREEQHDFGIDLIVSITRDGKYTGRILGVIVKGKKSIQDVTKGPINAEQVRLNTGKTVIPKDLPFPLCMFVFFMKDDAGYYRWVKEPVRNEEGKAELILNQENVFEKLTDKAIDQIIEKTNDYYEL